MSDHPTNDHAQPRRMKGNPEARTRHLVEHDELCTCVAFGCLPVDAPVTEPRNDSMKLWIPYNKAKDRYDFEGAETEDLDEEDRRDLVEGWEWVEFTASPTPPPASAPEGTPVERHLGHSDIADYYIAKGAAPNTLTADLVGIIERLCRKLDKKEVERQGHARHAEEVEQDAQEQRTRAEKAEADLAAARQGLVDLDATKRHLLKEFDRVSGDLAAAREREAKLREELGHAADDLEWAYTCAEQWAGATPVQSWERAKNGVVRYRAALASTKEGA